MNLRNILRSIIHPKIDAVDMELDMDMDVDKDIHGTVRCGILALRGKLAK
jgi:hypothetical protein